MMSLSIILFCITRVEEGEVQKMLLSIIWLHMGTQITEYAITAIRYILLHYNIQLVWITIV